MYKSLCLIFTILYAISMSDILHSVERKLKLAILRHIAIEEDKWDSLVEKMLVTEAKSRGHEIEFINPLEFICSTTNYPNYDGIISRVEIDRFDSHITDSYLRALHYFQTLNIPVINSSVSIMNAQDKFRTLWLAQNAGIPIPKTFLLYNFESIKDYLETNEIKYPFFIKKPYGNFGSSVYKIENDRELLTLRTEFQELEPILIQENIDLETDEKNNLKDMRIWVVRDPITNRPKFLGGVYRIASKGQYVTNISRGGMPTVLEYDAEVAKIAEQSLEAVQGDAAGIDIARDKKGNLYLIEVNISFEIKEELDIVSIAPWNSILDLAEARASKKKSSFCNEVLADPIPLR